MGLISPGNIRVINNRKKIRKWWQSPVWKEFVRINTEGKCCEKCRVNKGEVRGDRKPARLTVDHPYREAYKTLELYLDFLKSRCRVLCTTCNWLQEKGKDICPVCLIHYKPFSVEKCWYCHLKEHPEIEEEQRVKREKWKKIRKEITKKVNAKRSAQLKAKRQSKPHQ